jgi:hypothetical protein
MKHRGALIVCPKTPRGKNIRVKMKIHKLSLNNAIGIENYAKISRFDETR